MADNDSLTEVEQLAYQHQMYKLVIPIFLVIASVGILANLLVIIALKQIRFRNSNITLIMSLTLSDIWTISVVASSLLYNSYLPTVKGKEPNACFSLSLEIFRTGGLLTATLHLLLIAAHHCVVIIYPHIDHNRLKRTVSLICGATWIAPFLSLLLLATVIRGDGYWNCEHIEFYHSRAFRRTISGLLLCIFVAITGCYIKLYSILRSNREKFSQNCLMTDKKQAQEKRILWTMVLICFSFLIGWAPATIMFSITCKTCELLMNQRFRILFALSCLQLSFILGKSLVNPLIFSLRIPEIQAQLRRLWRNLPLRKLTRGGGLEGVISLARLTKCERTPERVELASPEPNQLQM